MLNLILLLPLPYTFEINTQLKLLCARGPF
jgi:hypothetical protein